MLQANQQTPGIAVNFNKATNPTHGTIVGLSGSRSLMGQLNQSGIGVVHTHDKKSPNLAGQGRELKDFNGYLLV